VTETVFEPSVLPIVLFVMLTKPALLAWIPINKPVALPVPPAAPLMEIPEIVLLETVVAVVVPTFSRRIARKVEPETLVKL
jgi:hypothetical protein